MKKKILVIDDDPITHLIITETFKNNFDIVFALNSKMGYELASKILFDGYLIDFYLGTEDYNGVEIIEKIKLISVNKAAIYVAITSSIHPTVKKNIIDAGYNFLFHKPLVKEDIIKAFG